MTRADLDAQIRRLDHKLRVAVGAGIAFLFLWCGGTAILFGLAISTFLIYLGAIPFIAWEIWYLYYGD